MSERKRLELTAKEIARIVRNHKKTHSAEESEKAVQKYMLGFFLYKELMARGADDRCAAIVTRHGIHGYFARNPGDRGLEITKENAKEFAEWLLRPDIEDTTEQEYIEAVQKLRPLLKRAADGG